MPSQQRRPRPHPTNYLKPKNSSIVSPTSIGLGPSHSLLYTKENARKVIVKKGGGGGGGGKTNKHLKTAGKIALGLGGVAVGMGGVYGAAKLHENRTGRQTNSTGPAGMKAHPFSGKKGFEAFKTAQGGIRRANKFAPD